MAGRNTGDSHVATAAYERSNIAFYGKPLSHTGPMFPRVALLAHTCAADSHHNRACCTATQQQPVHNIPFEFTYSMIMFLDRIFQSAGNTISCSLLPSKHTERINNRVLCIYSSLNGKYNYSTRASVHTLNFLTLHTTGTTELRSQSDMGMRTGRWSWVQFPCMRC